MGEKHKEPQTVARATAVLDALKDEGAMTIIALRRRLKLEAHLVHYTTRTLKAEGRIHIAHWERPPHSHGDELWVAAFAAGPGQDAPDPKRGGLDWRSTIHLQQLYVTWAEQREPEEIEA